MTGRGSSHLYHNHTALLLFDNHLRLQKFLSPRRDSVYVVATMVNDSNQGGSSSVFAPISHPILKSVDPVKVAEFLREREKYETEVSEKSKENSSLVAASYKVSVDQRMLKTMIFLGKLKDVAPGKSYNNLTSAEIETWIKSLIISEDIDFNPEIVEQAVKTLRVNMKVSDPRARMLQYACDFFSKLDDIGYGSFKEKNPKMTVKLMAKHLYPFQLKEKVVRTLEYREELEAAVPAFVELMCETAESYETWRKAGKKPVVTPNPNAGRDEQSKNKSTPSGGNPGNQTPRSQRPSGQ